MGCLQPKKPTIPTIPTISTIPTIPTIPTKPTELTILFVGKDRNLKRIFFPEDLTVEKESTDDNTIRKSRKINGKKIELEFQDFKFDSLEPKQSESKIPSVIIYLCDTEMKKSFEEISRPNFPWSPKSNNGI